MALLAEQGVGACQAPVPASKSPSFDGGIFTKVKIVAAPARFDDDDDFLPSRPEAKKGKKRIYDSEDDEAAAAASSSGKYNTKDSTS